MPSLVPAVPTTIAPSALAICTAAVPTAPLKIQNDFQNFQDFDRYKHKFTWNTWPHEQAQFPLV